MKKTLLFLSAVLLAACSSEKKKIETNAVSNIDSVKPLTIDSSRLLVKPVLNGIDLFIDSMKNAGYLIDTNRLKQVGAWYEAARSPKAVSNGSAVALMPFPDEAYGKHFTDPKTYFFAQWNEEQKTFKNGDDFLLMTWTIDSTGIRKEKAIYDRLQEIMGNFPCYIFRSKTRVYAVGHRMTVNAINTRKLTERLRNYIDPTSLVYRPFNGYESR